MIRAEQKLVFNFSEMNRRKCSIKINGKLFPSPNRILWLTFLKHAKKRKRIQQKEERIFIRPQSNDGDWIPTGKKNKSRNGKYRQRCTQKYRVRIHFRPYFVSKSNRSKWKYTVKQRERYWQAIQLPTTQLAWYLSD